MKDVSRGLRALSVHLLIGVMLHSIGCDSTPRIDVDGGHRITYATPALEPPQQQAVITALQQRLKAWGLKGCRIVASGPTELKITLPGVGPDTLDDVQKLLVTPGHLEFRILAKEGTHDALIAAATEPATQSGDSEQAAQVRDTPKSKWVAFDPATLELPSDARQRIAKVESGKPTSEVLIVLDDHNVEGSLLASVEKTVDTVGLPMIAGSFVSKGGDRMRALTTENSPQGNVYQHLGVVLDDRLIVAPRIVDSIGGQFALTGNFTHDEVDLILAVLRSGQLPVTIDPIPVKVERVPAKKE